MIRYNVAGNTPWPDLAFFVSNKGISLASVLLIAVSYLANRRMPADEPRRAARRALARRAGLAGFLLMLLHSAVSVGLLTWSQHYPRLGESRLNSLGLACVTAGTLAAALFAVPALCSHRRVVSRLSPTAWGRAQRFGYFALLLTAVHVLTIGIQNFTAFGAWPAGLPPISLLATLACVGPVAAKLVSISQAHRPPRTLTSRPARGAAPPSAPGRRRMTDTRHASTSGGLP